MVVSMSVVAFAGTWEQSSVGWKWNNGDGTYAATGWKWIDDNGDNLYQCYYFDKDGICFINGTTPDGYTVNKDGAWTVNDVIQIATEIGPSMTADDKATAKNNIDTTSVDTYLAKLSYSAPEPFEKYVLHSDGSDNICIDLYLPATSTVTDSMEALALLNQSTSTFESISSTALEFFNKSVNVIATAYTADGTKLYSKTYYGHP